MVKNQFFLLLEIMLKNKKRGGGWDAKSYLI